MIRIVFLYIIIPLTGIIALWEIVKKPIGKNIDLRSKNVPRGFKNNNPGNLKIGNNDWKGRVPTADNTDGLFEQFYSLVDGIRAMMKLIRNYDLYYSINTISGIISRYSTTDQDEYIAYVSGKLQINPNFIINVKNDYTLIRLVKAMIQFENGYIPIEVTDDIFSSALNNL